MMSTKNSICDFINLTHDKLIDIKDDLYLIEKDINENNHRFVIIKYNDDKKSWYENIYTNDDKAKTLHKFELLSNGFPGALVFREDPIGYPNNNSIVAFSLDEKPSKKENIIYYEIVNGLLTRNEALINFAKSTKSINSNSNRLNNLKQELSETFPRSFVSQVLRINNLEYWYERQFSPNDIVQANEVYNEYQQISFDAIVVNYAFDFSQKEWVYGVKKLYGEDNETLSFCESELDLKFNRNYIKKNKVFKELEKETNNIIDFFNFDNSLEKEI